MQPCHSQRNGVWGFGLGTVEGVDGVGTVVDEVVVEAATEDGVSGAAVVVVVVGCCWARICFTTCGAAADETTVTGVPPLTLTWPLIA